MKEKSGRRKSVRFWIDCVFIGIGGKVRFFFLRGKGGGRGVGVGVGGLSFVWFFFPSSQRKG